MATGGEETVGYSLTNVGTVTLENTNKYPDYISIVVCQDKIVVLDWKTYKVQIHGLKDGKVLATSDSLESGPRDMCLMDAMTICVLHDDGLIKIMSIDSTDMSRVFTTTRTLRLQGVLDKYRGVVRFNDSLVVTGIRQDTMYWCIVSLHDGHVDAIHQICKGDGLWCRVTTKDTIIYISCYAGRKSPDNTGVYGFDILNPSQCKYTYKHQRLQVPTSIVINEDGNIFVCNSGCIHQLTASCQLVAIFTQGIPWNLYVLCWYNGRLYGTCMGSNDITVFRAVYQGSHKASEVLVSDERKQPVIEDTAIQIGQGNVDKGQPSVETEMPPSGPVPSDSEDKKHGDNKASEVPIIDERKQPVVDETAIQKGQEIRIQQSVGETLNQAKIQMSTEDQDLFIRFQREIGTTRYFSKDPDTCIDGQESLKATEMFFEHSRPDMKDQWLEYKNQGKLTSELIAVIYSEERNPELHVNKDYIIKSMEQLNVIVKARSFNENGLTEENYFFTPCMIHKEYPREFVAPEQDPHVVSTSVLCWVITGNFLPPVIFQKLIAACLAHWPVAKKNETSENLIFQDCTVFDLDPMHRLFLRCEDHVVFARVTRMGTDDVNAKMCTRVRKFITLNLAEIISQLDPNLKYKLCLQIDESQDIPEDRFRLSPPCEMWFVDEVHDPDAPITREHMNHARLCVALSTVCGNAMRDILLTKVPTPHANIYLAILANKTRLTSRTQIGPRQWQNALLNNEQIKMLFPDPKGRFMAPIDQLDISLVYTLIRNVSTVHPPSTGWGVDPSDNPRDESLGANVERIHSYRNHICGHSPDGKISQEDFEDHWNKFEAVLLNVEKVLHKSETGIVKHIYSLELEKQKRQVISVYEAC